MQNKNLNEGAPGQNRLATKTTRWRVDYAADQADMDAGGRMRVFDSLDAARAFANRMREDGRFGHVEVIEL